MKRVVAFLLCLILVIPSAVCVYAERQEPETIKILAIGNSFTENSVSMVRNFSDGDISAKTDLLVASLTIGGISLETHEKNIKENAEKYKYIKRYKTKEEKENVSIRQALTFEEWDYIVVQQVSHLAGLEETYEPYLGNILKYIKGIAPNAQIVFNQTWAYEIDSTHTGFSKYNNSQSQMFMKIRSAYNKYASKYSIDIIPCAEAFQLARGETQFDYKNGGSSLCKDGYHANVAGCYLLGAVWYEYFTKKSVWDNVYTHKNLTKSEMYTLKRAAHNAVNARYTVSGNNDDTYGFLVETVTSKKPQEYISSDPITTTSAAESNQTTTTSATTSIQSQTTSNSSLLVSDEISSDPSELQTAVPMPKQKPWLVIILVTFISLVAVGGAVVLVVFLATKNKK